MDLVFFLPHWNIPIPMNWQPITTTNWGAIPTSTVNCIFRADSFGLLLLCLLMAIPVKLRAAWLEEDYRVRSYTVDDGLPNNSVIAIDQTPDGYLWFATYNGLVRYDGIQFKIFDGDNTPELGGGGIFQMHQDRAGRLWIVTADWEIIWYWRGRFERCTGKMGLPAEPLDFSGETPDGRVAIGRVPKTREGFWFDGQGFKPSPVWSESAPTSVGAMATDRDGFFWQREGTNWLRANREIMKPLLPSGFAAGTSVKIARPQRRDGFWLETSHGLIPWQGAEWGQELAAPTTIGSCASMVEDHAGTVWIGTWTQGLWRVTPDGVFKNFPVTRGTAPEAVRAIFEDREGNLWLGTEGSGIRCLQKQTFKTFDTRHGLAGEVIRSLARDSKDRVWILSQAGLDCLEVKAGDRIRHVADVDLGWDLYCDHDDWVWIGTFSGKLLRLEADRTLKSFSGTNQVGAITSLYEDKAGQLWIGSGNGLWKWNGTELLPSMVAPDSGDIKVITQDQHGVLWLGKVGSGLWRNEGPSWQPSYTNLITDVRALLATKDALWVGTPRTGLARITAGGIFNFPVESGLPRQINSLLPDALGNLWIGTGRGIYRLPLAELNASADTQTAFPRPMVFGKAEGLPTSECSSGRQPLTCQTSDGRLWFSTVKGVVVVDPRSVERNEVIPPLAIEEIRIIGSRNPQGVETTRVMDHLTGGGRIQVEPGTSSLEIHYSALSFTAPERVRFRYLLEGLDQSWTEAETRRVAYFHALPPGDYRFRVTACNNDGIWNPEGVSLALTIQPRFTQTYWFKGLMLAALASLAGLAYRARLAQIKAVNQLRLRLSADLHDEIGANLGSIGLNTELVMSDLAPADPHRRQLQETVQVVSLTAQSVRDIVWFTNPEFDTLAGMIQRMRQVATLMLAGRQWSLDLNGRVDDRHLSVALRKNVFLIFKESLHNIVKHSQATTVTLSLDCRPEGIRLTMLDNGSGFTAAGTITGNGLKSMRQRAEEMGGAIRIESQPGKGTQIVLEAPFRRIESWLQWLRRGWRDQGESGN